jgi:hypothetical protein
MAYQGKNPAVNNAMVIRFAPFGAVGSGALIPCFQLQNIIVNRF